MHNKLRIGIIGAARVARYAMVAPAAAQPRAKVVAVASRDAARGRAYAAELGIPRSHDSYAAMVDDSRVDLVYVATPPKFHVEHASLAIAAGKPVLVEKPFAMDAAEAGLILDRAAAAGVPVFEAMHSRCHAIWPRIAEILASGVLGRLVSADAVFDATISDAEDEFRWNAGLGGGALMDLGVYPLSWVRAIFGEPLLVTSATMLHQRGTDAAVAAQFELPHGATASIAASMVAPMRAELAITGELGTLLVSNPLAPQRGNLLTVTTAAGRSGESVEGPGTYDAQLAALCATLLDGAAYPLPPRDALASMQAIDAVRAAVETTARQGETQP